MSELIESLICPYCKETDFDLIGLKGHLLYDCTVFSETMTPNQAAQVWHKERMARENNPSI